jgi:hypothetical protein
MVGNLKITRVLHAGYIFEDSSVKIIFDPIFENPFSVNCYAYPNLEFDVKKLAQIEFDAVFISHFHDDHCSFASLNLLKKTTPIYMYCLNQEMFQLLRELGFQKVYPLKLNQQVQIGQLRIVPHRALDEEVDCIFQISSQHINVLNVVDSWMDYEKVKELSDINWNLILWPFQTMRELEVLSPNRFPNSTVEVPFEWVEQLQNLKPRNLVPSSCQFINEEWSWYNHAFYPISYSQFINKMQKVLPETQIFKFHSGQVINLSEFEFSFCEPVDWIKPLGSQDVDYQYRIDLKSPSMAELSQHFKSLSSTQEKVLKDFCHEDLLKKLNSVDYSNEPYFKQDLFVWRLKIYGNSKYEIWNYDFQFKNGQFNLLSSSVGEDDICWLTEIVAAKLWSAIFDSEGMTSLYIRINDRKYSVEKEKQLKDINLTEDPLIRLLYDEKFASYQKRQLEQIRTTVKF